MKRSEAAERRVEAYLGAVEKHLAHKPPAVRQEIVAGLRDQIGETLRRLETNGAEIGLETVERVLAALVSLARMAWEGHPMAQGLLKAAGTAILASFAAFMGGKCIRSRFLGLLGAFFGVNWALLQAGWDGVRGHYNVQWRRMN